MNRLKTICSLIPVCGAAADIGCDHGKISEHIVKNGLAKTLIVNDISALSLQKAQLRLSKIQSGQAGIQFVCSDGADLSDYGIDCAVIAGLGGREILKIIKSILPPLAVLAPQNFTQELRRALWELGYGFQNDIAVRDEKKFYDIFKVIKGNAEKNPPDECASAYGHGYKEKNETLLLRLLKDRTKLLSYPKTSENLKKLQIIEEVLTWQQ